jgi:hypothetical protein
MERRVYVVPMEGGPQVKTSSFSSESYASAWAPDNLH